MRTVVTGGAGFIGSNLVKALLESNRSVSVADNLSRGNIHNIAGLGSSQAGLCMDDVDLRNYKNALKITKGMRTVFHLAAKIGSIGSLHGTKIKELDAFQTNTTIDTNVFRACQENGVKNLIYASSVGVYSPNLRPLREEYIDTCPNNPDGGYGWSKLIGEKQLDWLDGIHVGIARICNVYGNNSDISVSPPVISNFMLKAIHDQDIIISKDGRQARDFIYVSDVVSGLLKLESTITSTQTIVNLGSGVSTNINTLAKKVIRASRSNSNIIYKIDDIVGPVYQVACLDRTKSLLNWKPEVSLDMGLEKTYKWIKEVVWKSS